jgi:hypothetical protein
MSRWLTVALLVLVPCLAVPSAASAKVIVGLGDQNAWTFADPAFKALKLKSTRLTLAWDWHKDPAVVAQTDLWVAAARSARVRPLIAFNRNWRSNGHRVLPSLRAYRTSFRKFRARYPHVRDFSAWNEANHSTQPTARRPRRAAQYYNALRRACGRCTVVAADVLDSADMGRWIAKFEKYARKPRLWGLHNYKDANDANGSTRTLLRLVRGTVWLTETGGIRRLRPSSPSARGGRKHSLRHQAKAVRRVMRIARSSRRIRRVYFYEWQANPVNRWDSAFRNADGTARPAYFALRAAARGR